MNSKNIKNILITDSIYSLLIYTLYVTEQDFYSTLFFVSDGVDKNVRDCLPQVIYIKMPKTYRIKLLKFLNIIINSLAISFIKFKRKIFWGFLDRKKIYGVDHLLFSFPLIGNNNYTLIEDGTVNYIDIKDPSKISKIIHRIMYCKLHDAKYGKNNLVTKIILTKPMLSDPKVETICLEELWHKASKSKQNLILGLYNITYEELTTLSSKTCIILTQPLSEDGLMSEQEKIDFYKGVVDKENPNEILLKTHPRERTDYNIYFPNIEIFKKSIPFELFTFLGVKFKKAYTFNSTAINNINYDIEKVILGNYLI